MGRGILEGDLHHLDGGPRTRALRERGVQKKCFSPLEGASLCSGGHGERPIQTGQLLSVEALLRMEEVERFPLSKTDNHPYPSAKPSRRGDQDHTLLLAREPPISCTPRQQQQAGPPLQFRNSPSEKEIPGNHPNKETGATLAKSGLQHAVGCRELPRSLNVEPKKEGAVPGEERPILPPRKNQVVVGIVQPRYSQSEPLLPHEERGIPQVPQPQKEGPGQLSPLLLSETQTRAPQGVCAKEELRSFVPYKDPHCGCKPAFLGTPLWMELEFPSPYEQKRALFWRGRAVLSRPLFWCAFATKKRDKAQKEEQKRGASPRGEGALVVPPGTP